MKQPKFLDFIDFPVTASIKAVKHKRKQARSCVPVFFWLRGDDSDEEPAPVWAGAVSCRML